jgi:hypothetical protein
MPYDAYRLYQVERAKSSTGVLLHETYEQECT